MSEFSGMDGDVTFAAGYDSQVKSFDITDEVDIARTLNFDSATDYETTLTGAKRWSGSITADFDDSASAPASGDAGAATLQCKTGKEWSGDIVVSEVTNSVEKSGEAVEISFNFEGNGELSRP